MTAETFESVCDVLPEPMMLLAADGNIIATNQMMRQTVGIPLVADRQSHISEIFSTPPDEIRKYLKLCSGVRQFIPGVFKLQSDSGGEIDVRCEGSAIDGSEATARRIMLRIKTKFTAVDRFRWLNEQIELLDRKVRERKQMEEELRESNARFEFVREASQLGFWFCDLPFDVLTWDAQVKEHFSIPKDARVTIDDFYAALHPDDRERTRQAISTSIANRTRYEIEYRTVASNGVEKWIRAIGRTFYDGTGQPRRFDGITQEITQRKRAEDALREANVMLADKAVHLESLVHQRTVKLQETVAELEAFSYSVAHDVRAPLRAMQGYSDALMKDYEGKLDAEAVNFLQRISRGASRLDLLVRDVLAYSRIAKGEVKLKAIDLDALIVDIIQNYSHLHPSKIRITVSRLEPVMAHEALLTQIISNLLGNAAKFSAPDVAPEVRVSAETTGTEVRIWIEDNGIGIDPQHHHQIFQIFGRVYPEKRYEGTGIGLAIVKKAAERMGGSVGVESELGKGSRFWITLKKAA